MEGEAQRIERRIEDWEAQAARNKDARESKKTGIEKNREEASRLEAEHAQAEAGLDELQAQLVTCARSAKDCSSRRPS